MMVTVKAFEEMISTLPPVTIGLVASLLAISIKECQYTARALEYSFAGAARIYKW